MKNQALFSSKDKSKNLKGCPLQFLFGPLHTCDIFLEPDREIWDFSEGDWGLR